MQLLSFPLNCSNKLSLHWIGFDFGCMEEVVLENYSFTHHKLRIARRNRRFANSKHATIKYRRYWRLKITSDDLGFIWRSTNAQWTRIQEAVGGAAGAHEGRPKILHHLQFSAKFNRFSTILNGSPRFFFNLLEFPIFEKNPHNFKSFSMIFC